jgi:hypothetical protein
VLDEQGALVIEDHQRSVCLDEVGEGSEQGAADVEADPPNEDGPVIPDPGPPNTVGQGRCGPPDWAGVVIDLVEAIALLLQLLKTRGDGLLVKVTEQGLVEAFVLALGGRFIGFAGDRLDPKRGDIGHQRTQDPASGRLQRCRGNRA